jgi:hypothetical protein
MDFGMLMMSQRMPADILSGMKNEMAPIASPDGSGPEFINLLDLVEGMEVAEMSSASDSELNFSNLGETLEDETSEKVQTDKNAALAGLAISGVDLNAGLINKTVGQDVAAKAEALGTENKVVKEFTTAGEILLDAPTAQQIAKSEARLGSASVAAWTAAFASGELKHVDVAQAEPEGIDLKMDRKVAKAGREIMSDVSRPVEGAALSNLEPELAAERAVAKVGLTVAAHETLKEKSAQDGFVPMAASVERVARGDQSVARVHGDESLRDEKPAAKKNASVQAKDFFLDRSEFSNAASGPQTRTVLASAVGAKGLVSKTSDQNVVDFVSDKVQNLQAAGGGSLRVGLETKDMGQIEIKVTLRAGRVDVKISGESPELTRQLEASRSELTSKLEKHVELGDLSISKGQFSRIEDSRQVISNPVSMRLTEDLVRNAARDGIDMATNLDQPRSERLEALRSSAPLSRTEQSNANLGQDFARDERRGQALEQWANFSQMRRSA